MDWFVRRIVYVAIGLIGLVLVGFGILSAEQTDQLSEQALAIVPSILTMVAGGYAASKTHPGSDSTVTAEDVAHAAIVAREDSAADAGRHREVSGTADYAAMVRGESNGTVA